EILAAVSPQRPAATRQAEVAGGATIKRSAARACPTISPVECPKVDWRSALARTQRQAVLEISPSPAPASNPPATTGQGCRRHFARRRRISCHLPSGPPAAGSPRSAPCRARLFRPERLFPA